MHLTQQHAITQIHTPGFIKSKREICHEGLYLCVDSQLGEDIAVFLFNSSCIFQEPLQFQLARVLDLDEQVLHNYLHPC